MPMLPYPPSMKPSAADNSLLRVLGGVLALVSILLTLLGIILHQGVSELILAIIVGIFALRVLILWLGDKSPQPISARPSINQATHPILPILPMQPYSYTQVQPNPYASPTSYPLAQPLYKIATEQNMQPMQHMQQTATIPPTEVAATPPKLPRSIRPQQPPKVSTFTAQPAPPSQGMQPSSPSHPVSLQLTPPYTAVSMPSSAPLASPSQDRSWQYEDEIHFPWQQRGNDDGTA